MVHNQGAPAIRSTSPEGIPPPPIITLPLRIIPRSDRRPRGPGIVLGGAGDLRNAGVGDDRPKREVAKALADGVANKTGAALTNGVIEGVGGGPHGVLTG